MPSVSDDWLADDAAAIAMQLDEIHSNVDGAQPTDDSISGDEYDSVREFINGIDHAADQLRQAHYDVVDADEVTTTALRTYDDACKHLRTVAYYDLPTVPSTLRTAMEEAKVELQDVLSECPDP